MKVKTLNKTKSNNSEVVIKDEIFGIDPNEDVILRVLNWQLAKKQQGNHKVKSRSEVKSTTAKMYRQKGGGRARHGASSVVQFRGGGVVHGPVVRSHGHKLNKKIRKLGLKSALSSKVKNDNLIIVDKLDCDGKTSSLKKMFVSLKINSCCIIQNNDASDTFVRAIKNIPNSIVISELGANVYDILKHKKLIITESAIKKLEERLTWTQVR